MVPMYMELTAKHEIIKLKGWKTLGKGVIWSSKSKGESGNAFKFVVEEPDETAPEFYTFSDTVSNIKLGSVHFCRGV